MAEKSYDDMTVEQLEDELEERGLPKSGNKDDLVERLEKNDEVLSEDDDTSAAEVPMKAPGGKTKASPAENTAVPTKDSSDEDEDEEPSWRATAPATRRSESEDGEVSEEDVGVFVGVDPDYQNFANDSDAPLLSESGVEREAEERSITAQAESQRRSAKVGVTGHTGAADYDLGREKVKGFSPTSKPPEDEESEGEEEEEQG